MPATTVQIAELIRFYDEALDATRHSNAVKTLAGEELALAVFEYFLQMSGRKATRIHKPCTTEGARLDGWIKVQLPEPVLFQIEVKSWSMHGYGNKKQTQLPVDASEETIKDYKIETWKHYWEAGGFKPTGLKKVLRRMRAPTGEGARVEPVACLWAAVHPEGLNEPFFKRPVSDPAYPDFPTVHVFSVSAYLRMLLNGGDTSLALELPDTEARIRHLERIFGRRDCASGQSE